MNFYKEGDKKISIFSVSKTLKKLRQVNESTIASLNDKSFGGQMTEECKRFYDAWSYELQKEIIIFTNGIKQDIYINDCLFSYIVKGIENHTRRYIDHYIEIQGCWPNDEEFVSKFDLRGNMDEFVAIIYAMIILAETKDVTKSQTIWKIIYQENYVHSPAERLQLILDGEEFSKKILEKYPFMTQVFKDGLSYHINKAKEEILKLEFLK